MGVSFGNSEGSVEAVVDRIRTIEFNRVKPFFAREILIMVVTVISHHL